MAEPYGGGLFIPVDHDPFTDAVSASAPNFAPPSTTFDQFARGNDIQNQRFAGPPLQVTVRPQGSDLISGVSAPPPAQPNWAEGLATMAQPSPPQPAAPALPPAQEVSTVTSPLAANQRLQAELENPYVMDRLIAMTRAEVSNLGPEGAQKFLETVRNRALAEGVPIARILGNRKYYPGITYARAAAPVTPAEREQYGPLVEQMLAGSNTANYATGNASYDPVKQRWVGFQGGPTTSTTGRGKGTELWGIEAPNLGWARSVGYEGGEGAPYIPENTTAFDVAARQTARGVRPEGGRKEGYATRMLENFVPNFLKLEQANQIARPAVIGHMIEAGITRPQRAFESAGSLQRGGSYDPSPAIETAGGMFGPGMLRATVGHGVGEAGVFGGRLSATANHAALIKAENMEAAGIPAAKIHQDTGWFKGVDGQWRYEINDQNARLTGARSSEDMSKVLEHPELYEAYPHMRGTGLTVDPGAQRGQYMPGEPGRAPYMNVTGENRDRQTSIALHEAQHGVQEYEGFTPGSSTSMAGAAAHGSLNTVMDNLLRHIQEMPPGPERKALEDRYGEASRLKQSIDERDLYHRTAGEVEARNVQVRQHFSPEMRQRHPPQNTQDVPTNEQIVRKADAGVTLPRSYEPKPGEPGEFHTLEETFGPGQRAGEAGPPGGPGVGEGGSRRAAGVAAAQRAAEDAAGSAPPLIGLPQKPLIIDGQYFVPGPSSQIQNAAQQYMRSKGMPYEPPQTYAPVDKERATKIADEFARMPHAPDDPKVKASYAAMIKETVDQFKSLQHLGIKFEPIPPGMKDPYASSPRLANKDMRDNKHLWYYPTDQGFGTTAADISGNPLLAPTSIVLNGKRLPANDVFRIVHDVFGHFKEGVGFRADGEENAWRSHAAMYSKEALGAMTSETRGQNSWLNYGPHGENNRTAKSADTTFADQKTGLMPEWTWNEGRSDLKPVEHDPFGFEDFPGAISSRLPFAKEPAKSTPTAMAKLERMEDPLNSRLRVDVEAMKKEPESFKKNVALVRGYPLLTTRESRLPVDEAAAKFVAKLEDNYKWLHGQVPPEIAERSKLWYDGANRIAQHRAQEYGLPVSSTAGVYAALSPQKDWYMNVSLGDRLLDSVYNHAEQKLTADLIKRLPVKMHYDFPTELKLIEGKSLSDIMAMKGDPKQNLDLRALWVRAHDESMREPSHHIIAPEGHQEGLVLNENGQPGKVAWGGLSEIGKALRAIDANGNTDKLSMAMGGRHKVRSFYNNILHPNDPFGDVTIDTHAVAGGLLQPLGGTAPAVSHNFKNYAGKGEPGASGAAISGVKGTYPLYADATRNAAHATGLLPREMQSITWEATRGLFPDTYKTAENLAANQKIWHEYRQGRRSLDSAREAIVEHAGGFRPPTWWKP